MAEIITLCGSTKFKNIFEAMATQLSLSGKIVLLPNVYEKADNLIISEDEINTLIELHKEKIKMSNKIIVLNVDGYIGDHTKYEIEYAKSLNIPVYYLEHMVDDMCSERK